MKDIGTTVISLTPLAVAFAIYGPDMLYRPFTFLVVASLTAVTMITPLIVVNIIKVARWNHNNNKK